MSRNYNCRGAKMNWVYSVDDIQELYEVCRNTVSNWVAEGLCPTDCKRPQLFNGAELNRFHKARRARTRKEFRCGEFKCTACSLAVFPESNTVGKFEGYDGNMVIAKCPECKALVYKLLNETDRNKLFECRRTNTPLASIDERKGSLQGRVGTKSDLEQLRWSGDNDRTIHKWLSVYAGKYDVKTIDAHLASIRDFERWLQGEDFRRLTEKKVAAYREHLKKLGKSTDNKGLSKSTIRHRASQLRAFFAWLLKQDGFRKLSKSIPGCLELPKYIHAADLEPAPRPYPTIEEAEQLLNGMNNQSTVQLRNRAIFALAFLTGLRSNAIASLRITHILVDKKQVIQDARLVRAKNGKSLPVNWFPVPKSFEQAVIQWLETLRNLGLSDEDALFPAEKDIKKISRESAQDDDTIAPMASDTSVRKAFAIACSGKLQKYTPHSAKDTLAELGETMCQNHLQHKAWSHNLGHKNLETTKTYYAKMTDHYCAEIFEEIRKTPIENVNDLRLLLAFYEHQLVRGTENFERAEKLADQRRAVAKRSR